MRIIPLALLAGAIACTTGCIGGIGIPGMGPDPVAQHIDTMKSNAMVISVRCSVRSMKKLSRG